MTETETKKAHKREKVLVDVIVTADLSNMIWLSHCRTLEERAKQLQRAAKELDDFLRDHRSQDLITLDVNRIYKNLCSACGCDWEPYEDNGKEICAGCGAEIEEQKNEQDK